MRWHISSRDWDHIRNRQEFVRYTPDGRSRLWGSDYGVMYAVFCYHAARPLVIHWKGVWLISEDTDLQVVPLSPAVFVPSLDLDRLFPLGNPSPDLLGRVLKSGVLSDEALAELVAARIGVQS